MTVPARDGCEHEWERVPCLYVDGRPLYRCTLCDLRVTRDDDDPSFKALAPLREGA